jgi:hypothetical protein
MDEIIRINVDTIKELQFELDGIRGSYLHKLLMKADDDSSTLININGNIFWFHIVGGFMIVYSYVGDIDYIILYRDEKETMVPGDILKQIAYMIGAYLKLDIGDNSEARLKFRAKPLDLHLYDDIDDSHSILNKFDDYFAYYSK